MKIWSIVLVLLAGLLLMAGATQAAPPAFPETLPAEIRALFVEAEDEVELKTLPNMPESAEREFWIDNQRVIFTSRKFKGWVAQKNERAKIVVYNVDTGQSEETPYRGNLWCFGPEGQMLVQDYPAPINTILPGDAKEDSQYFMKGTFGQPLARFKRPAEHGAVNPATCAHYSNRDHDFGRNHSVVQLRKGDGVLDSASGSTTVRLMAPDGKTAWSIETYPRCNAFGYSPQYLPWINSYFSNTAFGEIMPGCANARMNSWLFSTTAIEEKPLPNLIQEARKLGHGMAGNGSTYWARRGMYLYVQFSTYKLLDGLYWADEKSGQLKRVLKRPWGLKHLSPDGCRNLVMVSPPVVVELCKGNKS